MALFARSALSGYPPLSGPLLLSVTFVLPRPKSVPKHVPFPAVKPDIDNLEKAILDGCTAGGIWHDDSRVVMVLKLKIYGVDIGCHVAVHELYPEPNLTAARIADRWIENMTEMIRNGNGVKARQIER